MKKTTIVFIVLLVILSLIGCTANKGQNALNDNTYTKARKVRYDRGNANVRQMEYNPKNVNNERGNNRSQTTTTPIKHVVVIFGENVSFDHYFGTYPHVANLPGEPKFIEKRNTPQVNGLEPNSRNGNQDLLNHNPNAARPALMKM